VSPYADFLAVGAGYVWFATSNGIAKLDPHTKTIVRIRLGGREKTVCGIAGTADAVWVAIGDAYCDTIGQ
jgi:streptogramin lyase